ncbi:HugZ family pyridoxamine 5'-phosphate oxidase [Roseobacter sinensis]|uniref:DUF2470 domain-containing protein n=1 Tax=Roseobacter sinensis TaxID=2931391 RepID=A0ABT3BJB8_9RHOB|nr:DUF2470 domain-containing protein [Roseobacter sp. WL0113]MCV3273670.1 DUF2470 domain-containing protein [Roseobacter sp. WL0113]
MTEKNVLQPVDAAVRRTAKTFLRSARHAALATLDPASGIPMASRISVATDSAGQPLFLISQLSGHFGALEADPRASVLLGEPGKGDPLAHPRITVFGRAQRIADESRALLRARFLARHPKAALYADFGDFAFWRLQIEGASFNGGFGKAYQLTPEDLCAPTDPALDAMEQGAVAHMNEDHADAIALYAREHAGQAGSKWQLACIDLEGLDLISSDSVARVWFDPPLTSADDLRPRLVDMAKAARASTSR